MELQIVKLLEIITFELAFLNSIVMLFIGIKIFQLIKEGKFKK